MVDWVQIGISIGLPISRSVAGWYVKALEDKKIEDLPTLYVEVYLNEQNDDDLNGKNNSCKL